MIYRELPSHVICLADGARDAYHFLLDTKKGIVIWGNPEGSTVHAKGQGDELRVNGTDIDEADWWKGEPTFEVGASFEVLKERFQGLEWMPHPFGETDVWEADEDEHIEMLRKIIMRAEGCRDDLVINNEMGRWNRKQMETKINEKENEWM